MAKRKNSALFQATLNNVDIQQTDNCQDNNQSLDLLNSSTLKSENIRLTLQNQEFAEKISQYLNEIDSLKTQIQELRENNDNIGNSTELVVLRNENDNYLIKISDLTFENAKLQAQLAELSKTFKNANNDSYAESNKNVEYNQSINVPYHNMYKNNGYNDWN